MFLGIGCALPRLRCFNNNENLGAGFFCLRVDYMPCLFFPVGPWLLAWARLALA